MRGGGGGCVYIHHPALAHLGGGANKDNLQGVCHTKNEASNHDRHRWNEDQACSIRSSMKEVYAAWKRKSRSIMKSVARPRT